MKKLLLLIVVLSIFGCLPKNNKTDNSESQQEETAIYVRPDTLHRVEQKEQQKLKPVREFGYVTTIADGYDVKQVNLWSKYDGNRRVVGKMFKGDKVEILGEYDPYVWVKTKDGTKGWCMDGFIVKRYKE